MVDLFLDPTVWGVLFILIGLELALGVDNIVFVSLIMARVPEEQRATARRIGLGISAVVQIALLFIMLWIAGVERTAFSVAAWSPSWSELAFLAGGLFLIYKAVSELHINSEHGAHRQQQTSHETAPLPFATAIIQVAAINAVFSVDTVITAIGVTRSAPVIIAAILITTTIIYFSTAPISAFLAKHKSVRALALCFLLVVGGMLTSEGLGIAADPVLFYAVIGLGTLVLFVIKLLESREGAAADIALEEPLREEPQFTEEPSVLPVVDVEVPVVIEAEPAIDDPALEENAIIVQESNPKRRTPRRKTAPKGKVSSQG